MIGFEDPFDEMLVKNPPVCPPPTEPELVTFVSVTFGEVWSFQTLIVLPPLETTLAAPSGSTK